MNQNNLEINKENNSQQTPPIKEQGWKKKVALFLSSQNISLFGSSVVSYAVIWHITMETSSGVWMMLATICSVVPQVLVSLFAGVWADRYHRKYLIMLSDGFIALATLGLAIFFWQGQQSLELLLAVSVIRSIGGGIQAPAVNALYPQIVPTEKLTKVQGINQSINSVLLLLSPAVGGIVLGTMGIVWAFLLDVVSASFAVFVLSFIKIDRLPRKQEKAAVFTELKQGLQYALQSKLLRRVLVCFAIAFFLFTPAAILTPLYVERVFGSDVWLLTANEVVWTVGSLVGGIFVSIKENFKDKIKVTAICLIGFGVTFAFLGLAPTFFIYLIIMGVSGFFMPIISTTQTVLLQENVEPGMMGRVFSLVQIVSGSAMPIAILLFGPLADAIPIAWILVVTGALLALLGLVFGRNSNDPTLFRNESI